MRTAAYTAWSADTTCPFESVKSTGLGVLRANESLRAELATVEVEQL